MEFQRPVIPLLCARYLPPEFAGRALAWMPDRVRYIRNFAFYVACLELIVSIASFPLAAARGNLGKASTGIHALLACVSIIGVFGLLRLQRPAILLHAILALGIPICFGLFLIFTLTLSQGGKDSADAIVVLIFISLFFDAFAGLTSFFALFRMHIYIKQCERHDAQAAAAVTMAAVQAVVAPPAPQAAPGPADPAARQARALGLQEQVASGGIVLPPNAGTRVSGAQGNGGAGDGTKGLPLVPARVPGGIIDDGLCVICAERERNTAFFPCGHMCCQECAGALRSRGAPCHICRRNITDLLRVYE